MKKILVLLSIILMSGSSQAADFDYDNDPEEALEFETRVDTKTYPLKAFEKKGVKVKAIPQPKPSKSAIPDQKIREDAFKSVKGLPEEITALDAMARDILYVQARTKTLPELKKTYPQISEKVIERLHARMRKP